MAEPDISHGDAMGKGGVEKGSLKGGSLTICNCWQPCQAAKPTCFMPASEVPSTQELPEGCPIYTVPLAIHVPMNPEEKSRKGLLQVYRVCVMLAWSQASGSSGRMLGKIAGNSASSKRRQQSWSSLTMCFETASCLTVSLPLAAESLAVKPLRSAVRCGRLVTIRQWSEVPVEISVPCAVTLALLLTVIVEA